MMLVTGSASQTAQRNEPCTGDMLTPEIGSSRGGGASHQEDVCSFAMSALQNIRLLPMRHQDIAPTK